MSAQLPLVLLDYHQPILLEGCPIAFTFNPTNLAGIDLAGMDTPALLLPRNVPPAAPAEL